jgi:MFS transporter, DHA2 family, multidrug resistance protein
VFLINAPVVLIGLVAIALLLPESRDPRRPRIDVAGVVTSSLGLVGLTYGVIQGGENGWGEPSTLLTLAIGIASLIAFALRQLGESRRPDGRPLVDLALLRSPRFTWGGVLATLSTFAMFGVLFAMPQYFQAVIGADALGTGLRLLPIIGGLLLGAQLSDRITPRVGPAVTVALRFALLAVGLMVGATTRPAAASSPASRTVLTPVPRVHRSSAVAAAGTRSRRGNPSSGQSSQGAA